MLGYLHRLRVGELALGAATDMSHQLHRKVLYFTIFLFSNHILLNKIVYRFVDTTLLVTNRFAQLAQRMQQGMR